MSKSKSKPAIARLDNNRMPFDWAEPMEPGGLSRADLHLIEWLASLRREQPAAHGIGDDVFTLAPDKRFKLHKNLNRLDENAPCEDAAELASFHRAAADLYELLADRTWLADRFVKMMSARRKEAA